MKQLNQFIYIRIIFKIKYRIYQIKSGSQQNLSHQMQQQKRITILIDHFVQTSDNFQQILQTLSSRVDMPKHLVQVISKKLNTKNWKHIFKIFELLQLLSCRFEGGIALFTQISNKEFLFKINSLLTMKDMPQQCKQRLIDTIFCWKKLFKPHQQLLPAFWTFLSNFQKKGYTCSNPNFETMHINTNNNNQTSISDIHNTKSSINSADGLKKLNKAQIQFFRRCLQRILSLNKIIDRTDHEILDFPPVLKQKIGQIKMSETQLNKIFNDSHSEKSLEIALALTDSIRLSQKRHNDLVTRYMPQKFILSKCLQQFNEAYPFQQDQELAKENVKPHMNLFDLVGIGMQEKESKLSAQNGKDLLDMNMNGNNNYNNNFIDIEPLENSKNKVNSFFNNLLGDNNKKQAETLNFGNINITLQQNDFRTDLDFKSYDDTPVVEKLTKKLTDMTDFNGFLEKKV